MPASHRGWAPALHTVEVQGHRPDPSPSLLLPRATPAVCRVRGTYHLPPAAGGQPGRRREGRSTASPPWCGRGQRSVPAVTGLWSKVHSPWPEGGWVSFCLSQPPDWSLGLPGGRGGGGRLGAGDRTEGMVTLACVAWGGPGPTSSLSGTVSGGPAVGTGALCSEREKNVIV